VKVGSGAIVGERFVLERQTGAGGMGAVHRARDLQTGAPAAVKILRGHSDEAVERFLREVRALANLAHPAIVRHLAHGVTESGELFVAMQWLEGEDLRERLRRGPLSAADSLALLWQLADALELAHAQGILHRDIKPANVWLDSGDARRPVLLDFGLARSAGVDAAITGELVLGTPGYMAPEQARARRDIDARADLFSLGCLAFHCLTGRPPFEGDDLLSLLARVVFEDAPRLRDLDAAFPRALDELLGALLAKDPAERPASAVEVKQAIAAIEAAAHEQPAGEPATERPPAAAVTHDELVVLSVALAAGELDEAGWTRMRLSCALHGGAPLEQLADGTVAAVFSPGAGDKAARRDAPLLAARFAQAMRHGLGEARMAVATGKGVTGCRLPFGEVIDRAVRLLRDAPSAEVLLDDSTAAAVEGRFEILRLDDRLALGKEIEALAATTRSPLVGRRRELAVLDGLYQECVAERLARGAIVSGSPGVGKTRLAAAALERWRAAGAAPESWTIRCDPALRDAPYRALGRSIQALAGIADGDPLDDQRRKLAAAVAERGASADLVPLLGEMAAIPFPGSSSSALRRARLDASAHAEAMRLSWRSFVEAASRGCPLVLVVDDLQWCDGPSVALLERMLRIEGRSVFVLATARNELHERFPLLWRQAVVGEVRLAPLARGASLELAQALLGGSDERAAMVAERSGGNPFHLEQLALTGRQRALPDSMLLALQERLLALGPDARRLLRAASVLGTEIDAEALATLTEDLPPRRLASLLRELADRELLEPMSSGASRFTHELLREAAYSMLPDGVRERAHRRIAEHLEAIGGAEPLVLAQHHDRGANRAQAAHHYGRAAERALAALDLDAAFALAEKSAALEPRAQARAALRLVQGEVELWRGHFAAAQARTAEALDEAEEGSALWLKAAAGAIYVGGQRCEVALVLSVLERLERQPTSGGWLERVAWTQAVWWAVTTGQSERARRFLERIEAALPAADDDEQAQCEAWTHWARLYWALFVSGHAGDAVESAARAAEAFERIGLAANAMSARAHLGWALAGAGELERAERVLRETLRVADEASAPLQLHFIRWQLAEVLLARGAAAKSRRFALEALAGVGPLGLARFEGLARTALAAAEEATGAFETATQEAERAAELLMASPPLRARTLSLLARLHLRQGRTSEAEAHLAEALNHVEGGRCPPAIAAEIAGVQAELVHAAGRRDEALALLRIAREGLIARLGIETPALARVPVLQRLDQLAAAWG
jgi:tetratricopeptide (TPR) repeat protein